MNTHHMRLLRFRVTNFRSVEDSGWIETSQVTALIGTNESGKTNLLLPLWKLKPAKEGSINPIADFPRKRYNEIRAQEHKPVFIQAQFALSDDLTNQLIRLTGAPREHVQLAEVTRNLAGKYSVLFPKAPGSRTAAADEIVSIFVSAEAAISELPIAAKAEESLKEQMIATLREVAELVRNQTTEITDTVLTNVLMRLQAVDIQVAARRSVIAPRYGEATDQIQEIHQRLTAPSPVDVAQARQLVVDNLPSFVYYSNYGNLDSEIYLPHVIENMKRSDLGAREEAKVRTLRVLFDFVRLKPEEILELGRESMVEPGQRLTDEQIQQTAVKKKEREILLQSASTELTQKFRAWWKQGDYRFRLNADGDHFRIWVSDDKRPEEIELEGRSSGLQWFLSFYLIFLVERQDAHKGAILLLDEPGVTLHPLSQADLSAFFEGLSETNQLLYTTHSPFLVDADHLDRVKAVYVDSQGATVVSSNLRASEATPSESRSVYPVHAALGLTVSVTLLQGCQPIIVEGTSDQYYLSAIKTYLISQGLITPSRELLFMPSGGRKGITSLIPIVTGKDEDLPYVLLDSDHPGQKLAQELRASTYKGSEGHVILIGDVLGMANAEIEDIFPMSFLSPVIAKYLRGPEKDFDEVVRRGEPIVPQVEAYAQHYSLTLEPGWKVEVAKRAKERLLRAPISLTQAEETVQIWTQLFGTINGQTLEEIGVQAHTVDTQAQKR